MARGVPYVSDHARSIAIGQRSGEANLVTAIDGNAPPLRHTIRRSSLRERRRNSSLNGRPQPTGTPAQPHNGWKDALLRSWLVDDRIARGALLDGNGPTSVLHFADFPSGHHIYADGQPTERIYVIISGIVKITCTAAHGRQVVRALLGPGDVLDELTIFNAGPHSGTATCQTLVRTAWLNTSSLHRMIKQRPQLAQVWLGALARELRRRDEELVSLRSADIPERVARQLILLAQRFGERTDGTVHVTHSLTRREFAQLAGATTESVSKALANFVERGWIITAPGSYEIMDAEPLRLRARMTTRVAPPG
jgi:CRP/FNR family cyclic AMP-dependent transcriptional regulator